MNRKALITGASSGIGRALALKCAEDHFDVVLLGRDVDALEKVALECRTFGAEARALKADLALPETLTAIHQWLDEAHWEIDLLVNNAGFGVHGNFSETDLETELGLVRVQIDALLGLTKLVLAPMLKKGRGEILNIGSVYSFSPVPFQSVYSACKAFLLSFSESLSAEFKGRGITITALCPGITYTAFRSRQGLRDKTSRFGMSAEMVAEIGYRGLQKKKHLVVPGFWNALYVTVARHLPMKLVPAMIAHINARRLLRRQASSQ